MIAGAEISGFGREEFAFARVCRRTYIARSAFSPEAFAADRDRHMRIGAWTAWPSVVKLIDGKPDNFLAFPLMVHSACATLFYVIRMSGTRTSGGSMIRLAALALILMILGMARRTIEDRSPDF